VIAADRGAVWCLAAGITPDIVVGDMDSITEEVFQTIKAKGIEIARYDRKKDMTDTQIAMDMAVSRGADNIDIIAGIGSRFDHSMANVHLLYRALKRNVAAKIITGNHEIFLIKMKTTIYNESGTLISFLPLGLHAEGVYLKGFEYELEDAELNMDFPVGISNVITSDTAEIQVGEGILLAVIVRDPD
jgi:thiamine pyrophosphokinase